MGKLVSINEAVNLINDGDVLGIGGNVLHRSPMALVREVARQGKRNLKLVKTAGAMDVDLLCFAGCVSSVDAGFISYETKFGLAAHYRKAVESGAVKANEHACYTVMSALRAGMAGIPFMPVRGLVNSELIDKNDYFTRIADPFSGELITVVKAINPDVAIVHAHAADEDGNAIIEPPYFDDILLARAAKKVIVSAERIAPPGFIRQHGNEANIPHFSVVAVVKAENGAAPCSCPPSYDIREREIAAFKALKTRDELVEWLNSCKRTDGSI